MAQKSTDPRWHMYVAATTAIVAVLAAIASFQASSYSSLMLEEKNNSILFQSKANKEWNNYLALDITRRIIQRSSSITQEQQDFQKQAESLESQVTEATRKFQAYFQHNSHLVTAGTFLEIAIAILSMSILVKQKFFWIFSLLFAGVGVYFLALGLI